MPVLKLNFGSKVTSQSTPAPSSPAPTPAPSNPRPQLQLKTSSQPSTPAISLKVKKPKVPKIPKEPKEPKTSKTKIGRPVKPSAKVIESRKRALEESDTEAEDSTISVQAPAPKKIKLNLAPKTPKTPVTPVAIVLKAKKTGKVPKRIPGEGYDSEASDRELDPAIEEEFVLRMLPGDDCEYLRKAIEEKRIGMPKHAGGADVHMKFFQSDGRRAAVTIRGHVYAATLVDLPCIVEGMKSWDKRGWWKSADICQMLWVFAAITNEAEARTIPLPAIIDPVTHQYPHGLTAPMRNARKTRFRKRLHKNQIEAVEKEVERLLAEDAKAVATRNELIDPDYQSRQYEESRAGSANGYDNTGDLYSAEEDDEDAEGELDDQSQSYFNHNHGESNNHVEEENYEIDADLEADLEAAMQADDLEPEAEAATPMSAAATPSQLNGHVKVEEEEDSGDESYESGDDEGMGVVDEVDEEEKARQAQIQGTREDIAELESQIVQKEMALTGTTNVILKGRVMESIRKLKQEFMLKRSSIGEGEGTE